MISPENLRVLIVDDEALARERLRGLLETEPGVEIIGECLDGTEAVQTIHQESPDLVFLDVQMPELDGFDVLRALDTERLPAVVFITAYHQYAVRAFEASAVDYLLKPFDSERLRKALQRGREKVRESRAKGSGREISDLLHTFKTHQAPVERLTIKEAGRVIFVKVKEIDWIRAADNYAELHVGKTVHLLRQTMTVLEKQLSPQQFVRISRSFLVNLDRIAELHPTSHGGALVLLRDGSRLMASRNHRKVLQDLLEKP